MNPTLIPGNEPDPGDMSADPDMPVPTDPADEHGLPDGEAEHLGDFA